MDWSTACWGFSALFWGWVVFFRGAERIEGTWLAAYLIEPIPGSIDPVHLLKLVGVIYLLGSGVTLLILGMA